LVLECLKPKTFSKRGTMIMMVTIITE
jgi:hypothetical protein